MAAAAPVSAFVFAPIFELSPMRILRQYLTRQLLWFTLIALAALVAVFAFFTLFDQLEETNRGDYGVADAVIYVALTLPRLAAELLPIAAVTGAMAALGALAQRNELDIMRTSGVSKLDLSGLLARSALALVVLSLLIGEVVAPRSEKIAQHRRSVALSGQITLETRHGFWVRDGDNFINVRRVLPDNRLGDVYIYEFDRGARLRASLHARQAAHAGGGWTLYDIVETRLDGDRVRRRQHREAPWATRLKPEIVKLITIKPQYLTARELYTHIRYLRRNAQSAAQYEQALYAKIVKPFTIVAMIVLAVPLVKRRSRRVTTGQRVFIGVLIGVVFHLLNLASINLGAVHGLPPALMVCLPTLLLGLITWRLMVRY